MHSWTLLWAFGPHGLLVALMDSTQSLLAASGGVTDTLSCFSDLTSLYDLGLIYKLWCGIHQLSRCTNNSEVVKQTSTTTPLFSSLDPPLVGMQGKARYIVLISSSVVNIHGNNYAHRMSY